MNTRNGNIYFIPDKHFHSLDENAYIILDKFVEFVRRNGAPKGEIE